MNGAKPVMRCLVRGAGVRDRVAADGRGDRPLLRLDRLKDILEGSWRRVCLPAGASPGGSMRPVWVPETRHAMLNLVAWG